MLQSVNKLLQKFGDIDSLFVKKMFKLYPEYVVMNRIIYYLLYKIVNPGTNKHDGDAII